MGERDEDILRFVVEGSNGDEYRVTLTRDATRANAFCICPAGENGQYCKHRIALLDGDISSLLSDNSADVESLKTFIRGSDLEEAHHAMCVDTKAYNTAKSHFDKAKRALTKSMYR